MNRRDIKADAVAFRERLILSLLATGPKTRTQLAIGSDSNGNQVDFVMKRLRKQLKARICGWPGRCALYELGSAPDAEKYAKRRDDDVDLLPVKRYGATVTVRAYSDLPAGFFARAS